jgi:PAS domain S-box-containing protein
VIKTSHYLEVENRRLILERDELQQKLHEATEIIEYIKRGKIDAVINAGNKADNVLVSKTADQSYRKFIESMSAGVVAVLIDGVILYCNSSFAALMNLPLENVIGANILDFIPSEYINQFHYYFQHPHVEHDNLEVSVMGPNGNFQHYIVSSNMLDLQDFPTLNFVWSDVTRQKLSEEKLKSVNESLQVVIDQLILSEKRVSVLNQQLEDNIKILETANVELSTFAHIASHDLQEPLRKLLTFSSILRTEYFQSMDERGQKYVERIHSASARMRNLITDILKFSEISQSNIYFEPVDMLVVIKEAVSDLEISIAESGAKIIFGEGFPVIEANTIQIRRLFQNIIGNSLKFIKAGITPQIEITHSKSSGIKIDDSLPDEEFCVFTIRDNGIGFNPEYKNKIFTIFQRLHNNDIYAGTGIGLAICRKIVGKHHGYIFADSKPNEGVSVQILLPMFQTPIS